MATGMMIREFWSDERYRLPELEDVLTPALVVFPDIVASNINKTLDLLGGAADRWRAHVKTAKLGRTMRLLVERGVRNFKCATTLELKVACESAAADVLVAYPVMAANARRVREIADDFPQVRVSVLAENVEQVRQWRGTSVGIFVDINPGMNRTGIEADRGDAVLRLIREIETTGLEFRGLHYYDGQYGGLEEEERTAAAHAGYDHLLSLVEELRRKGVRVQELITAGTPTFPCSLSYRPFRDGEFVHRVSPGTIVYGDATSLAQLPSQLGYAPAALVLARIVSHPHACIVTCDAGHKAVSADAGMPTCVVVDHSDFEPLSPSEEHLPIKVGETNAERHVGQTLLLLPRHICPTVNNFDLALLVKNGCIESVERVSARGREAPLLQNPNVMLSPARTAR